jgi:hypothetical protein
MFYLNGSDVSLETSRLLHTTDGNFYWVTVETSKNHPEGFNFCVRIDTDRPNCVSVFMSEFISIMGIRLGDPTSFFACKLAQVSGSLKASLSDRVSDSTMRNACKLLITAAGLDPRLYALLTCPSREGPWRPCGRGLPTLRFRSWVVGAVPQWSPGTSEGQRRSGTTCQRQSGSRASTRLGSKLRVQSVVK